MVGNCVYETIVFGLTLWEITLIPIKLCECLWSSNLTVYFIAGFCLLCVSLNLTACYFSWKRAWLSPAKGLNDFGAILSFKAFIIAWPSNFWK